MVMIKRSTNVDATDRKMAEALIDNYKAARLRLSVRLKDRESLKGVSLDARRDVFTREGKDFIAFYQLLVKKPSPCSYGTETMAVHINDMILDRWGISLKELRKDALSSCLPRACLYNLYELAEELTVPDMSDTGKYRARNLFDDTVCQDSVSSHVNNLGVGTYVLTNQERFNGASLILLPEVLERIAGILQDSYYILPSSIHEVLIVPLSVSPSAAELEELVRSVNDTIVEDNDFLSDKVQFYDERIKDLFNASDYERRKSATLLEPASSNEGSDTIEKANRHYS